MSREDWMVQTLEAIRDDITEMKLVTIKQEENLKEHMRRSLANEAAIDIIKNELKQVDNHILLVQYAGKVVAWLAGSSVVLYLLRYLLDKSM